MKQPAAAWSVLLDSLTAEGEARFMPLRLADPPGWLGHAPFARWLVRVLAPGVLVELGAHSGNSYCAMAQSVAELGLATACFAVDTWQGDAQAGYYDESVFAELAAHHDPLYGGFSRLVRRTFDQALPLFADRTVDLLHIDGCHAYDNVRHDFSAWLPKLSPRAVVLLHDTGETREGFGVSTFWAELRTAYPGFGFAHSHGLGVLAVGPNPPPAVAALAGLDHAPEGDLVRAHFAGLGRVVENEHRLGQARRALEGAEARNGALAEDLARSRQETKDARRLCDRQTREYGQERARALALAADLASRSAELAESERVANALRRDLEARAGLIRALRRAAAAQGRLVKNFRAVEKALLAQAQALRDELGRAGLLARQRLEALNRERARAETLRYDLDRMGRQAEAYRGSLSWRVTAPLRRLGLTLQRASSGGLRRRQARAVRESGLFDQAFYLARNPDVAASGRDAAEHYVEHGWREGRDPSPFFDQAFYLARHPEAARPGRGPLIDYLAHAATPGHDPNPYFDTAHYLGQNPDLVLARVNPLLHYLAHGANEGRDPHPNFVTRHVLLHNPDVAQSGENPLAWHLRLGQALGRPTVCDPSRLVALSRPTPSALAWQVAASRYIAPRAAFAVFCDARGSCFDQAVQAAESVLTQTYPFWRLALLADEGVTRQVLPQALRLDTRVRLLPHRSPQDAAAQAAAFLARTADEIPPPGRHRASSLPTRSFAVTLCPRRRLWPHALFEFARAAAADTGLVVLTADDALAGGDAEVVPRLRYGLPALPDAATVPVDECLVVEGGAFAAGGFSPWLDGPDGARGPAGALAFSPGRQTALRMILSQCEEAAPLPRAGDAAPRPARRTSPFALASVVIPTAGTHFDANLGPCLASLFARDAGHPFEVVLVDNSAQGLPENALARLIPGGVSRAVVRDDGAFNFSRLIGAGVRAARGELLVLLNDDVEVLCDGWLAALAETAALPGCAVAGAKLLYPDGRVQHAGMFYAFGAFRHALRFAKDDPASHPMLGRVRRCSAVTFACAAVPRTVWNRLGGLDQAFAVECNDTDFCLRAAQAGYFTAWTPGAALTHKESASRGGLDAHEDRARLLARWGNDLTGPDPFHHPHLSLSRSSARQTLSPVLVERHAPAFTPADIADLGPYVLASVPAQPETILAMDLGHLGDLVLALPALAALRRLHPRARLTLACSPANLDLARRLADADDIVCQPLFHEQSEKGLLPGAGPGHPPVLCDALRSRRFDLAVDLRRHPESRPLLLQIDAGRRVGYEADQNGLDCALPLTKTVADTPRQENKLHAAAQKFALALACAPVGPESFPSLDRCLPELSSRLGRSAALRRFGLPGARLLVGLHPGSGSSMRRWPAEGYAQLADRLVQEKSAHVVLFGAPDEADLTGRVLALCRHPEAVTNLAGSIALDEFCDLLPHLDAFVGNNSGPCHLAGIAGLATVVVWSGQVGAQEWLAMGPRTTCVRAATPCSPCYRSLSADCPFDRLCLRLVPPATVLRALEGLLALDRPEPARGVAPDNFDDRAYLEANPDVAESGMSALAHYQLHGMAEGRLLRRPLPAKAPAPRPGAAPAPGRTAPPAPSSVVSRDPGAFAAALPRTADHPLVCVVCHDASRTGAPLIALEIVKRLAARPDRRVCALLCGPGELAHDFAALAPTLLLGETAFSRRDLRRALAQAFRDVRPALCLANSAASARCALALHDLGLPVMSLVHEMPESIAALVGRRRFIALAGRCRPVVLPSHAAARAIADAFGLNAHTWPVVHSGSFREPAPPETAACDRARIRTELGLGDEHFLVLCCATLTPRKGADIFARLPTLVANDTTRFAWVGEDAASLADWFRRDARALGVSDRLRFVGPVADPLPYLHAADALALPSREDPFPLVVLEAMRAGLPVTAFAGAGGAPEALADTGLVAPLADAPAMARALDRLARDPALARDLGARAAHRARRLFTFERYMVDLEALMVRHHGLGHAAAPGESP